MSNVIPQERWKILNSQVAELEKMRQSLTGEFTEEIGKEIFRIFGEVNKRVHDAMDDYKVAWNLFDHDAVGLMQGIATNIEVLNSDLLKGKDAIDEATKVVRRKLQKIILIISAMEFWAEKRVLEIKRVNLKQAVDDIRELLDEAFEGHKLEIEIDINEDLKASIHLATIQMLLLSMKANSLKRGHATKLKISAHKEGNFVLLEVSDDGCGVDEKVLPKMFEYGVSGEKGTGLGLADAQERLAESYGSISCEAHGGLDNKEGSKGAKFIMKLRDYNRKRSDSVLLMADECFSSMSPDKTNVDLLRETLRILGLTGEVTKRLKREEDECNWPLHDDDIKEFISDECRAHGIPLPKSEDELKRWFCLIYMEASVLEGFSYGNLVLPEDVTGESAREDDN